MDVDESNFAAAVMQSPVPVILDCWADWCQPCQQLTPRLERIARSTRGAIRLAKLNVDAVPGISGQLGIRSLPTVFGLVKGRVVARFEGNVPDSDLQVGCAGATLPPACLPAYPVPHTMHALSSLFECSMYCLDPCRASSSSWWRQRSRRAWAVVRAMRPRWCSGTPPLSQ